MKRILVCSGKGGVGKTTLAIGIAKEIQKQGRKVGILDIDIDTPNIPEFMNIDRKVKLSDAGIEPRLVDDIEIMSIGLLIDTSIAVMWDGSRRSMAIEQLMNKVNWTCDVLIIDSPPGTTEEVMTIIKNFTPEAIFLVTTGHKASISDIERTLTMIDVLDARKKFKGIIMNMSHILCAECGHKTKLFDDGDLEHLEDEILTKIPYCDDISPYLEPVTEEIMKVI